MKTYCAGFLFDPDLTKVVLIEKKRPEWQAGKLNAIGGEIKPGETPAQAMRREFKEETGVTIGANNWNCFCILQGRQLKYKVHFYFAISDLCYQCKSTTDEQVNIYTLVANFKDGVAVANLSWLIPMAYNQIKKLESALSFAIYER